MNSRIMISIILLSTLILLLSCGEESDPTPPIIQPGLSMQYDEVTWLTSHNAFAYFDWDETEPNNGFCVNQQNNIAAQLEHGVRAFQLDIHFWDNNDPTSDPVIFLCHGTEELPIPACSQLKFTPLAEELANIAAFLDNNPLEVVTILFEDYVNDEVAIKALFEATAISGSDRNLSDIMYNPSGDAWNVDEQENWPTLSWMVENDQRLVVFSDLDYEGIGNSGHFIQSNSWASVGPDETDCLLRGDPSEYEDKIFLMYHLCGPRLMNGWECPELSTEFTPDQVNIYSSIVTRWENSCASELNIPPGFLSVDFVDGCPTGDDLCDPASIGYDGPLAVVEYFNSEVWGEFRDH